MFLRYILCAAAAYLLGSISTGVLLSRRLFHDDVRKHGSGGTGATNMLRTYRLKAALLTFAGDAAKAALAVLLGRYLAGFEGGCVAAVFAIVGHMWPLYFGFRGGKGVATLVGAITGIYPPVVLLCFAVWVVILMMTHYVSLASIVAGCCFPVFTIASPKVNQSVPFIVFSFVTAVLLLYTHRKNIVRLKNGTESKIYIWKPHRKADK